MFKKLFNFNTNNEFNLDADSFNTKYKETNNAVLIDVRTNEEFESGHIPDSLNIDIYSPDFKNQIEVLDKSKSYFIYCRSGNRSYSAGQFMKTIGFEKVYNLDGGILDWNEPLV